MWHQNIHSVGGKVDNVVGLLEDSLLNLLVLSETWHGDSNAVAIKRLRSYSLNVVEAACPKTAAARSEDAARINHGGLVVMLKRGINTTKLKTH